MRTFELVIFLLKLHLFFACIIRLPVPFRLTSVGRLCDEPKSWPVQESRQDGV